MKPSMTDLCKLNTVKISFQKNASLRNTREASDEQNKGYDSET